MIFYLVRYWGGVGVSGVGVNSTVHPALRVDNVVCCLDDLLFSVPTFCWMSLVAASVGIKLHFL